MVPCKVLLKRFHLNGHIIGFHPDSKVETTWHVYPGEKMLAFSVNNSVFKHMQSRHKKMFTRIKTHCKKCTTQSATVILTSNFQFQFFCIGAATAFISATIRHPDLCKFKFMFFSTGYHMHCSSRCGCNAIVAFEPTIKCLSFTDSTRRGHLLA